VDDIVRLVGPEFRSQTLGTGPSPVRDGSYETAIQLTILSSIRLGENWVKFERMGEQRLKDTLLFQNWAVLSLCPTTRLTCPKEDVRHLIRSVAPWTRIVNFPNTLNKDDTRKAISIAFSKWSDVSPLFFAEITNPNKSADIVIGVWLNDLVEVYCGTPVTPRPLMHSNATYTGQRDIAQDDIWGIQRLYEPLEDVTTLSPPPANVKIKMVPRGKVDGEQLLLSIPGYIIMKDRDLRIVANEFNEGTYTCRIHRSGNVVSANSWAIRLKPEQPSNS
ncbi:unnamed protein product, partial [Coregonus sp. 'balchen']